MLRQRILKLAVLLTLCTVVFVGQALAVKIRVTLHGTQTVTAQGDLTFNNVPLAGGAFNLTAPGGGPVSVELDVANVPNDVKFSWSRPAAPDTGSCDVNLPSLPNSVGIPSCAVPHGAATERLEIRQAVPIPSLTTYGLIALALLLAGTAVWMFRRRRVNVAV